ncbi:MAG TPA: PRC and DUF2382 domain-containing protein [Solirubrobacteraceae bacterium]|jgi:uncharacterized protein (TIGR02271 family)|nr:PRC and DUF2382 domain-containing protein [Solirubrobacteraceae bacterium]
MATLDKDRILQYRGENLSDSNGDKIGSIEEIYLDAETDAPEWALVNTGMFGGKSTFVPLRDASEADGALRVPFDKAMVKDAPKMDPNGQLSQNEEAELYRYYGMDYSETRSDTGLPEGGTRRDFSDTDRDFDREGTVGRDVSGPETDQAMTRSEEELRVGKTERESGRVRLRKHVVTDEVTKTVPVKREEIRLEREPITDANVGDATSGPDISEEEHEVVLHEEEVVAEKRAVPKERVRLDKDVEVEEKTVTEDVRREEIDIDDDTGRTRR